MNLVIFIIVICSNSIISNEWKKVDIEDTDSALDLICVDSKTCFLQSSSKIYRTDNKGETWKLIDVFSQLSTIDFSCPDEKHIFLGLKKKVIRYSTNGGESFQELEPDSLRNFRYFFMLDSLRGIISDAFVTDSINVNMITTDNWKSYVKYNPKSIEELLESKLNYNYYFPQKLDDSSIVMIGRLSDISVYRKSVRLYYFVLKLNLFNLDFELTKINENFIEERFLISDFKIISDSLYFLAGNTNVISGGSCHDAIFKSTNAGKSWRKVLDLYTSRNKFNQSPFGLQKIAFKNDSVGIAVGQFGKIVYTYDGGESWIYEQILPPYLGGGESDPPTMVIEYAGDTPIIGAFNGTIHVMTDDIYAPKPEDTLTISGKIITEDSLAKSNIPIRLNSNRITMTDNEGNYKFTKLSPGSYTVTALNKYFDGDNPSYYYEPFLYSPVHSFELTNDSSGIDFLATNIRGSSEVTGSIILEGKGLEGIEVLLEGDKLYKDTTNEEGFYSFQNIGKWNKPYSLFPNDTVYNYEPESYSLYINENMPNQNFEAEPIGAIVNHPNFQLRNNVLISEEVASMNYRVIGLNGRVVKSGILPKELSLNAEQTGTYILQITKGEQVIYTHKFQVVR